MNNLVIYDDVKMSEMSSLSRGDFKVSIEIEDDISEKSVKKGRNKKTEGAGYGGRLKKITHIIGNGDGGGGSGSDSGDFVTTTMIEMRNEMIREKIEEDPLAFRDPYEIGQILEEHIHDIMTKTIIRKSDHKICEVEKSEIGAGADTATGATTDTHDELKIVAYRERDVRNLFGEECAGIDHIFDVGDDIRIFVQDKFEDKSPTLRDVNHFIACVETVRMKSDRKYVLAIFACKIPPTQNCIRAFATRQGFEFIINTISIFELTLDIRARILHFIQHHKQDSSLTDHPTISETETRGNLLAEMRNRQRQRELELKQLEFEISEYKQFCITKLREFTDLATIFAKPETTNSITIINPPPIELIN